MADNETQTEAEQAGEVQQVETAATEAAAKSAPEFRPITSQADLDARIGARLQRERDKVAAQYADYADIKARAEQAEAEAAALRAKADRDAAVREVAGATGVDPSLLDLMRGDTREELAAAAEAVLRSRPAPANPYPATVDMGGGAAAGPSKAAILGIKDPVERVRAIAANLSAFR